MNTLNTTSFTAFIGIDWADAKHDICIQSADGDEREFDVIPHQVERIDEWAHAMRRRFGSLIAVAVELSKGPIVYALQKHDCFVIFPVNPSTLAKYREAFQRYCQLNLNCSYFLENSGSSKPIINTLQVYF